MKIHWLAVHEMMALFEWYTGVATCAGRKCGNISFRHCTFDVGHIKAVIWNFSAKQRNAIFLEAKGRLLTLDEAVLMQG